MERVTVKEASELLGLSEEAIRQLMLRKKVDIGFVVDNKAHHTYYIFRDKLMKLAGKENSNERD